MYMYKQFPINAHIHPGKKRNKHHNYTLVTPEILTNNGETTQFLYEYLNVHKLLDIPER